MDRGLIDQIVQNVLAQLQPAGLAVRAEQSPAMPWHTAGAHASETVAVPESGGLNPAAMIVPSLTTAVTQPSPGNSGTPEATIELLLPVVTAEVLRERAAQARRIVVGPKTILTPTANDWLRARKVTWQRATAAPANTATASAVSSKTATDQTPPMVTSRRMLLLSSATPALRSLLEARDRELAGWQIEWGGRSREVADQAARGLALGELTLVVVASEAAEAVVCLANRQPRVRAAVVDSVEHLRDIQRHLGANLLVINPRMRTFVELRNLFRACAALSSPQPPIGWE